MQNKSFIAAIAAILASGPVLAGSYAPMPTDPVVADPVQTVPQASGWTGGYAGVSLGYGDLKKNGKEDSTVYGLQAGYNYDMGNYVVGAELQYLARDMWHNNAADSARLKGRIGYGLGSTLLYGVVGATMIDQQGGYAVGFGADHMITEKVSVGAEYLYENVADFDGGGKDLKANSLAATINYHF